VGPKGSAGSLVLYESGRRGQTDSYFPTVWGVGNPTYLPEVFSIHVSVRKVVPTLTIKKR
jgi:hypothetical protein